MWAEFLTFYFTLADVPFISLVCCFKRSNMFAIVLWIVMIETESFCNNLTNLLYVEDQSVILYFSVLIHLDGVLFFLMTDCTWKIYFQEIKSKEINNILFSLKTKWNVLGIFSLGLAIKQGKQWSTKYRNNFMSTWVTYFSEGNFLSKMLMKTNQNLKLKHPKFT